MVDRDDETLTYHADEHILLDALVPDADVELMTFRSRHGDAFLVLTHSGEEVLKPPVRGQKTGVADDAGAVRRLSPRQFRVFSVRKTQRSVIDRFISVGRTRRNDVVIRDASLSKFHAYFHDDGSGFVLQDARSSNGTFVDDRRVPRQGEGPPIRISAGNRIRFGSVELLFLRATELRDLVRRSR